MKRHLLIGAAVAGLLGLAACDVVKVPGVNPNSQDAAAENYANTPGFPEPGEETDLAEASGDTLEAASEPAADTPEAVSETVDRDAAPEDSETPVEAEDGNDAPEGDTPAEGEDTADTAPLPTLAALNAVTCGLAPDAAPTPTVAAVAGATHLEEQPVGAAAVNGLAASLASFPGIVKLEPRSPEPSGAVLTGHCSATRIAEHWFVTAAHCVDEDYDELRMIGEAENLRSPLARMTTASLAICHGGYGGIENGYANDLALIRMTDEQAAAFANVPIARFGATGKPLAPANYGLADMAGWGITHYGGQLSNDLLAASISVTGTGPAVIYVASRGGAGPCVGDSGGPLYVTEEDGTKTVVGVLSVVEQNRATGEFCAGDYNGRYTNLQGYTDWINAVMARCEADPETCQ